MDISKKEDETSSNSKGCCGDSCQCDKQGDEKSEIEQLKAEHEELQKAAGQLFVTYEKLKADHTAQTDKLARVINEYDNFRRRSGEEMEAKYAQACSDVVSALLPVADNLYRAIEHSVDDTNPLLAGVNMTIAQFETSLAALGVTEVETKTFDPELHHAVSHETSEEHGAGEIVEVLQRGYKIGEKIIRYAMVRVVN